MELRAAVVATVSNDTVRDTWVLILEGPTGEVIEQIDVPWDGAGGFLGTAIDHVARLLNARGLAYVGQWAEYDGSWTISVNPIADWWIRESDQGRRA